MVLAVNEREHPSKFSINERRSLGESIEDAVMQENVREKQGDNTRQF